MADDDEIQDDADDEFNGEADEAPTELDDDEIDEEAIEGDGDEEFGLEDDDESFEDEDEEDDDEADDTAGPVRRSTAGDEDDEDDDLITPDDVEADLDTILKDRLVAADDEGDEEEDEVDDRVDPGDRLQPKRADEVLCPSCFLLVRRGAPMCPVGDDDCPIFSK